MKFFLFFIGLIFTVSVAFSQMPGAIKRDLDYGKPLNLKSYSGENVDLFVASADARSITIITVDYDHVVPTQFAGNHRNANNSGVAYLTKRTQIEKKEGVAISGTVSQAFLIYESTGLKIYFFDTSSSGLNQCTLLIKKSQSA